MGQTKTFISVSFQKEFIHSYPGAPEEVSFLREPHRHMLHIRVDVQVFDDDRELEFIIAKRDLSSYADTLDLVTHSTRSCETVARTLLSYIQSEYGIDRDVVISVSEDGENGAIIKYNTKEDEHGV